MNTVKKLEDTPALRLVVEGSNEGPTDEMLVQRVVDGDQAAFEMIMQRYQKRIYRFVFRYVGNAAEAEDLTQEIFIKTYKNLHRFRGDAKFSTWLYQIAKNMSINKLREFKRKLRGWIKPFDDDIDEDPMERVPSEDRDSASLVEGKEVDAVVQAAIQKLNPVWRTALILRDIEELTYEEIGEILDLAQGTVKSRIHRARTELKKHLEWYAE